MEDIKSKECFDKCILCSKTEWLFVGKREYDINEHWESDKNKARKYIFFNIWHDKMSLEVYRYVCKKCGFILDIPRPSEHDLDEKYKYLANVELVGSIEGISQKSKKLEYLQAVKVLNLVKKYTKIRREMNILDFGGDDGHFLMPMKKRGHNCYVVDYYKNTLKGIKRLGNTLTDIPLEYKFDLIICRHVLEHLAEPKKLLIGLRDYLNDQGLVYTEVPMELYKATMPNIDPVTHINFYQKKSIELLFKFSGYEVILNREKRATYREHKMSITQTLARTGHIPITETELRKSFLETKNLIYPNYFRTFLQYKHDPIFMLKVSLKRIFKNKTN
jgi:SAM-dependent methyltransferase